MKQALRLTALVLATFFGAGFIHAFVTTRVIGSVEYRHLTYVVVVAICSAVFLPLIRRGYLPRFSAGLGRPPRPQWAGVAGIALWLSNWAITSLLTVGSVYLSGNPRPRNLALHWHCDELTWVDFVVVPAVPIIEEVCFRALILGTFMERGRPWVGLWVSSATFAMYHPNAVPALLAGLVLGYIYLRTSKLGLCVVAHLTHNYMVLLDRRCLHIDWLPEPVWGIAAIGLLATSLGAAFWAIHRLPAEEKASSKAPDAPPDD